MPYADPNINVPVQNLQGGKVAAIGAGGVFGADPGSLVDLSGLPATSELMSATDNLTALAGGGQAGATPLTASINRVTTVATAGDSGLLPASVAGASLTVINAAAVNSMNVFPATGDAINGQAANTAFAVAAGKTCTFYCCAAGRWHTMLSA